MKRTVKLRTLIDENKPFLLIQEEAQAYLRRHEEDSQSLSRYIRLAEEYIINDQYAIGINLLRMYYDEYPAIQIAFKLAQTYYENKQLDEAKYWISRTKSDELRYKVGLLEARILFEEQNWEASERILEEVYLKFQQKDAAIEMLGDIATAQGFYKKAQRSYLELFEKASRNADIKELCLKILINETKVNCLNDQQMLAVIKRFKNKEAILDIYICQAYYLKEQYKESFEYCQSILHQGIRHPYLYILHDCLAYRLRRKQLFSNTLLSYLEELDIHSKEYRFLLDTLDEIGALNMEMIDLIKQRFLYCKDKERQIWISDFLLDYYLKYYFITEAQSFLKEIEDQPTFYPLISYFNGRLNEINKNWQLAISYYDEAIKALTNKMDVIHRLSSCYSYQGNYYLAWTVLERYKNTLYTYPSIQEDITRLKRLDHSMN